jgi:hypothetical protein
VRQVGSKNAARTRIDDLPDDTLQAIEVPDSAPEAEGRGGMGEGVASEAAVAGGGGAAAESAAGAEAALRRVLHAQQLQIAQRERKTLHETIRSNDAEIEPLRRLAYGMEVIDVEAGVTRIVVEEAGTGASPPPPPWKRMRKEQAASACVIGALQQRLVEVKKDHVEERAVRHSELKASVDAKMKAAVKETLAQVAAALECACCFEPLAPGDAVALGCGHTYCNRHACPSSSATECPECRQPLGARVPLFGPFVNVCELLSRDNIP